MSLLHAFSSVLGVCFGMFAAWRPQVFLSGEGPEADRKRAIMRFCGVVIVAAIAIEAGAAILGRR
jgi:hypothetical protein